jgi:hypothetical protein
MIYRSIGRGSGWDPPSFNTNPEAALIADFRLLSSSSRAEFVCFAPSSRPLLCASILDSEKSRSKAIAIDIMFLIK